MLLDSFLRFYMVDALLVFSQNFSLHFQMVTHFHLIFDQIFSLGEVSDKFLTLLSF